MADENLQAVVVDEASAVFLGRWNRLVSTTNWEKGRITFQWREALIAADAPAAEYSDDAWSQRVGGVTGQHVGRLRRVFERFDAVREQYPNLFWSHFQAAVDWNDAEMWLEGAVQSDWSVAEMRRRRAETLGLLDGDSAGDESQVAGIIDEDAGSVGAGTTGDGAHQAALNGEFAVETRRDRRSSDRETDEAGSGEPPFATDDDDGGGESGRSPVDEPREPFRPFANLADLPDDLHDAFEAMKLAILRHKLAEWRDISRDDVVTAIGALRELALAED